ncbi:protein adenylyltransferase SelO, mitochondrial-like isoform X2 [Tubulanus polymorphus]
MKKMEKLRFDNSALKSLPLDPEKKNFVRQVPGSCFSRLRPTPVEKPKTVAYCSNAMRTLLDLPESELERPEFAEYFSGNKLLPGSEPAAHCYCGHQFGYFSGQLGDGAAIYLGEIINKAGKRWEIQLKGAGLTPYSRSADGRKVLRSSIREFLCSEALHNLGIPTTRAGSCVTSDTKVVRDIFYDGHPKEEKATIVLRIAETFIRFGSFEIVLPISPDTGRKGPSVGRTDILHTMLQFTIKNYYPEIYKAHNKDQQRMYLEFYKEVVLRTARLVASWQCVGWCHGVLNTDNMSIYGLTIDYGPFGFMDKFDYNFICNGSDNEGRYAYDKQPEICKWNCMKLAETLDSAISKDKTLPELEKLFDPEFDKCYLATMRKKLGLLTDSAEDKDLVKSLLDTMHETGADMTNIFRSLSHLSLPGSDDFDEKFESLTDYILSQCSTVEELKRSLAPKMDPRQLQMLLMMMEMNPGFVESLGGGHRVILQELNRMEKAKEVKDMDPKEKKAADAKKWNEWLAKYIDRLQKEVDGDTSTSATNKTRRDLMDGNNPRIVLRNWIAQSAIEAAEKGDFTLVQSVLKMLENPYDGELEIKVSKTVSESASAPVVESAACSQLAATSSTSFDCKPPAWSTELVVT